MKKGMPLILLRNLNHNGGLANGTRLTLIEILNGRVLKCVIGSGHHTGREVLIPRVVLHVDDEHSPIQWKRRQFPVRVAFAITITSMQTWHEQSFIKCC